MSRMVKMMVTFTVLLATNVYVRAQTTGQEGTCAEKLTGCFAYLNGTTTPPSGCCVPLKTAVETQKTCLCNLYANPSLLKSVGVNLTQALNLPVRCKIQTDSDPKDFCKGASPSASPSTNSSSTSTGGAGSGSSGSGKNSAVVTTGAGYIASLLMLVAYVVFY